MIKTQPGEVPDQVWSFVVGQALSVVLFGEGEAVFGEPVLFMFKASTRSSIDEWLAPSNWRSPGPI